MEALGGLLSQIPFEAYQEEDGTWLAWIQEGLLEESTIQNQLDEIAQIIPLTYVQEAWEGKNWNEDWESNYEAIRISDRTAIRASFHEPFQDVDHQIIIDPRMSFGTGHHATTRLMIRIMERLDIKGKSVLDIGCGSGVLGIYAAMRGAAKVLGIDNHPYAAENAQANAQLNGIEQFEISEADAQLLREQNYPAADIVLANINRQVILAALVDFAALLSASGSLLLSGILKEDVELIKAEAEKQGLKLVEQEEEEKWVALHYAF
jgi:ribosomal protein L11 methyltransferase